VTCTALGVDLDKETLTWAAHKHGDMNAGQRLCLVHANVSIRDLMLGDIFRFKGAQSWCRAMGRRFGKVYLPRLGAVCFLQFRA
jgi:hypothetical protein